MAYIGNAVSPAVLSSQQVHAQSFNGNGSTVAFTLNRSVTFTKDIEVLVNNVQQSPYDGSYSVSGTTLTFSEAPSSGTANVYVIFRDYPIGTLGVANASIGLNQLSATGTPSSSTFLRGDNSWQTVSVTPTAVSSQNNTATDYFDLPAGTTAQRPGSPATGMIRYNTSNSEYEVYNGAAWVKLSTETAGLYNLEYLIVAGGGGGISRWAQVACGGSGAGGVLSGSVSGVTSGTNYTITVGAGGAGYTTTTSSEASATASNGNNSSAFSQTAIGGGGGHGGQSGTAGSGGSGGGAGAGDGAGTAGSGTSGQGFAGGTASASGTNANRAAGGGGGAGGAGANASSGTCGAGGVGTSAFSAWGAATGTGQNSGGTYYYAGGSGGASTIASTTPQAAGGLGGGATGKAGLTAASPGNDGTANTGGGGGPIASTVGTTLVGGNGGSGIVIVRYAGAQRGSGGTVVTSGGYTYHTFTSSGTYTA